MNKKRTLVSVASARRLRLSPYKGRLVIDTIRGLPPELALARVDQMPQKAAGIVKKLLVSLIANAENNKGLDIEGTYISLATVDTSVRTRKTKPRARGRADRIQKRYSNITLGLSRADGGAD